ncbi:MAG: hypothetical protein WBQ58_08610 [Methanoregula sp.]|uniref:hypothetical protein n=1 Tax=Methanoregula sp. TaxID=2052170 RepID=UPI003BAF7180
MFQISLSDFSKLNCDISNEIEKVLLKLVADGKIKVIPDDTPIKSGTSGEKRKRGRPPKIKNQVKSAEGSKRKRGRPKKG